MTYFGFTMLVNGVPIDYKGIQLLEHRMLSWIDPSLPNEQIMHKLANDVFTDFAFSKPLTLSKILDDCIEYKIIPIVNLCITEGTWKNHARLSSVQCAKMGSILRDYLKNRGFVKGKAYIAVFNEPNTQVNLSSVEVCNYSNAVHDKVGNDFDVVYGNDEIGNLDWNYLGKNCRAKVMGTHFLSCLGSWENPKKNWNRIEGAKTTANLYGKDLMGVECGSWFKPYCGEGHQINLDILAECKKYDIDCLIVLPDVNEITKGKWKLLGYRIFNNDFTEQTGGCSSKFNELMNFIKLNGTIPDINIPEERSVDGMIIRTIGKKTIEHPNDCESGYSVLLANELLYKNGFLNADKVLYSCTDATKAAAIAFTNFIKEAYPDNPAVQKLDNSGRIGRQAFRYLIEEIHDEFEREKYQFALEVMASPITVEGAGV